MQHHSIHNQLAGGGCIQFYGDVDEVNIGEDQDDSTAEKILRHN